MNAAIDIQQLSFQYPDGTAGLRGLSLTVTEGEHVAVVGPNGAGKSTLFFHLNGTFVGQGRVMIFGQMLSRATVYDIRKNVGLVFQDPNDQLFMPSVFEDVAFGPQNLGLDEKEIRVRVQEALEQVGMSGMEARVPHHLSLGERKKVAMAAVLAMRPRLLAIDEPSAGLDPRSRRALIEFLHTLPQTQIIATHDLDLALEVCQRAVIIDGGQVVADGPIASVLADQTSLKSHGLEVPYRLK